MKSALIIQGPIIENEQVSTISLVKSALKLNLFDDIFVSTYESEYNEKISNLGVNLTLNKDPGSKFWCKYTKRFHNHNRQILTTTSPIAPNDYDMFLKIRSDLIFTEFHKMKHVINNFFYSNKEYLFCDITSVDYRLPYQKILYHLCDWVIGFKKNNAAHVKSIPFLDEEGAMNWVNNLEGDLKNYYEKQKSSCQFGGEQWITLNLLRRNNFPIEHALDFSIEAKNKYEKDLQKVICIPLYKMGLRCQKYKTIHYPVFDRLLHGNDVIHSFFYKLFGLFRKLYSKIKIFVRHGTFSKLR